MESTAWIRTIRQAPESPADLVDAYRSRSGFGLVEERIIKYMESRNIQWVKCIERKKYKDGPKLIAADIQDQIVIAASNWTSLYLQSFSEKKSRQAAIRAGSPVTA
ncbi:MAG: hypothetical protein II700_04625 [Firmicutes bacterium]|nr:hypothetical protein [Bacillota bacterium]MBR0523250.1 hypothetical protein [Bacillota bacterium]